MLCLLAQLLHMLCACLLLLLLCHDLNLHHRRHHLIWLCHHLLWLHPWHLCLRGLYHLRCYVLCDHLARYHHWCHHICLQIRWLLLLLLRLSFEHALVVLVCALEARGCP